MLKLTLGRPDTPLRFLCLGAHCYDIEIGCGGTLLRLLAEHPGSEVDWMVLSSTPERERETHASAADFLAAAGRIRVSVETFRESHFPWHGEAIKDVLEQARSSSSPDVILTHHHRDQHQDHRLVAELTASTFRDHLVLGYEVPSYDGDWGRPGLYAPLPSAIAQRKIDLILRHYQSQSRRTWFRSETFRALMSLRGLECNAPDGLAEAFECRKATI